MGIADAVTPDLHVAGTPDLQNYGSSFTTLSEYTQALPSQAGHTLVMPGQLEQAPSLCAVDWNNRVGIPGHTRSVGTGT